MDCNFKEMSYKEFEKLSADILSEYLGKEFLIFKEGTDQGIDIINLEVDDIIIGQCKRYNTSFSQLYASLVKEKNKLDKLAKKPSQYFLFTSISLLRNQMDKIVSLLFPYIVDRRNIFDGKRINNLLSKDKYDWVRRNNLSMFIDSIDLLKDFLISDTYLDNYSLNERIKEHKKYYVETELYLKARRMFDKKRAIIITGFPGTGKTTISEMLILNKISKNKDFRIIYSASRDLQIVKDNLKIHTHPTIVFIDDFVGNNILQLNNDYSKSIRSIIDYVLSRNDLYLILNSRIAIFNQALQNECFEECTKKIIDYVIDVSQSNKFDKAEIFKKHLCCSELNQANINEVLTNRNYLTIINHKNYTARNIERITNKHAFDKSGVPNYFDYCMSLLDDPKKIWQEEFENNLSPEAKILLEVVYTLNKNLLREEDCKEAFLHALRVLKPDYDKSGDIYLSSKRYLNDSFIRTNTLPSQSYLFITNHSIKDFLIDLFTNKTNIELNDWYDACLFYEQLFAINKDYYNESHFKKLAESGNYKYIRQLSSSNMNPAVVYLTKYKVFNLKFKEIVIRCVTSMYLSFCAMYGNQSKADIARFLLSEKSIKYYDLNRQSDTFTANIFKTAFKYLTVEEFIKMLDVFDNDNKDELVKIAIAEQCKDSIIEEDLSDALANGYSFDIDESDLEQSVSKYLIDQVSTNSMMNALIGHFDDNVLWDIEEMVVDNLNCEDYSSDVKSYLEDKHRYDDYDEEDYYDKVESKTYTDKDIDTLFEELKSNS